VPEAEEPAGEGKELQRMQADEGADVTVRFVEIDPRVGGAYRVVIQPGSILANGVGDVVEVTGELFGKFSQ
jgi:hypothetical protein